jgi:hypothetical protein
MTDDQKMTKGEYLWAMFETWIIMALAAGVLYVAYHFVVKYW